MHWASSFVLFIVPFLVVSFVFTTQKDSKIFKLILAFKYEIGVEMQMARLSYWSFLKGFEKVR